MISMKDYSFKYDGCESYALSDINLTIEDSSLFIVTGLSGSGKSTILEAIAGIVPYCAAGEQSGLIMLDGEDISDCEPVRRAARIGYIGEDIMSQWSAQRLRTKYASDLKIWASARRMSKSARKRRRFCPCLP